MKESKRTRAHEVYTRIRADIFNADLKPGSRLKFPDLCGRYDTSVGVAREALNRLAFENLVHYESHRGYAVIELDTSKLGDLTVARMEVEPRTFRQAILHADVQWEADVMGSYHVMSRIDTQSWKAATKVLDQWFNAHARFHETLLAGCPSERLVSIALRLRNDAEIYRRWGVPLNRGWVRDVADEHKEIVNAALKRDPDLGEQLLRDHIDRTAEVLQADVTDRLIRSSIP